MKDKRANAPQELLAQLAQFVIAKGNSKEGSEAEIKTNQEQATLAALLLKK